MSHKDSLQNTFTVATVLCLLCAFAVSSAAVVLKPYQKKNAQLDRKSNILKVTGFTDEEIKSTGVEELFANRFEASIIDLNTGADATEQCKASMDAAGKLLEDVLVEYDQLWAAKSKKAEAWAEANGKDPICYKLGKEDDVCGIKFRERYSHVFKLMSEDKTTVEKYVFPARGNGLWSLMQGYVAVNPDFQTVAGLTFYDQAETPGLGGEVMNPEWKKKWIGKEIFKDGKVALEVAKGDQTGNPYGVDALSGATITSNGVTNMVEYWLGPNGFGPYIELQKSGASSSNSGGSQ